jgi:predicted enzyme related to lactoylglutathione lyase
MAGFNGIAWFEIGTDDPAGTEKFYGDVFGWTMGPEHGHRARVLRDLTRRHLPGPRPGG